MNNKTRKSYTDEFKQQAIQLALISGKPHKEVAEELGVGFSTLQRWINDQRISTKSQPITTNVQNALELENRRLRRELDIVRQEREILKAAAKYFAKENQ